MKRMTIRTAEFRKSSADIEQCPVDNLPEFAFIGRSNVGKSTLINIITGRKNMAKTSSLPGKTQLINHFLINNSWYLVDLPGYGYAGISKKKKDHLLKLINDYLLKRKQLMCVFVLLDIRINPQSIDKNFIYWLGSHQIPFVLVFTKTDKVNQRKLVISKKKYYDQLLESWESLPRCFFTSSLGKKGADEILEFIFSLIATDTGK